MVIVHTLSSRRPPAAPRTARSQASSRASSANRTRTVLSPASVPSCSVKVDSSMAWPMALATPASDTSSSVSPSGRPGRGSRPARDAGARRWPSGAAETGRPARRRRDRRRAPTFTSPSSAMSRLTVAWVTSKPRSASRSTSSCWLAIAPGSRRGRATVAGARACSARDAAGCPGRGRWSHRGRMIHR